MASTPASAADHVRAEPRSGKVALILDTNVMTEVFSIEDLSRAVRNAGGAVQAGHDDPQIAYRVARFKFATLLAWVCSVRGTCQRE